MWNSILIAGPAVRPAQGVELGGGVHRGHLRPLRHHSVCAGAAERDMTAQLLPTVCLVFILPFLGTGILEWWPQGERHLVLSHELHSLLLGPAWGVDWHLLERQVFESFIKSLL